MKHNTTQHNIHNTKTLLNKLLHGPDFKMAIILIQLDCLSLL